MRDSGNIKKYPTLWEAMPRTVTSVVLKELCWTRNLPIGTKEGWVASKSTESSAAIGKYAARGTIAEGFPVR
jgi:hypothetical protein